MIRKLHLGLASLALTIGLVGCSAATDSASNAANTSTSASSSTTEASTSAENAATTTSVELSAELEQMLAANQASHYSTEDSSYNESEVVDVTLNGSSAEASGSGVTVDGSTVTITAAGTYRLSGSLEGQILVNADGADVKIILNGVTLTSSTGSPMVISAADEVTMILAEGTSNSISDASSYADTSESAPSSAIDSAADLSIAGTGQLTVTGNNNDGINTADGLVIAGGTITVKAVDDGIRGKDYVIISDGTINVESTGDSIKADNETDADRGYVFISGGAITVSSGDDGIKGFTDVGIAGGTITVTSSVEAMEAQAIVISGGELEMTSSDDAINVSGDAPQGFWITGGTTVLNSGGDGLDSNAEGVISGGSVVVFGPTMDGNGSIDVQNGLAVSGGELWALGSAGMAESPTNSSTQAFVFANMNTSATGSVTILDASGTQIATITSPKQFSSILYSGSAVSADGTYTIQINGQDTGSVPANQYKAGMQGPGGR